MGNETVSISRTATRSTLGAALIAAALAVASGINSLGNTFVYDDLPVIVRNLAVTQPGGTRSIWMHDYWWHASSYDSKRDLLYRPLTLQTYRFDYLIFGNKAWGYHAVNVLLHGAVAALVVVAAAMMGCAFSASLLAGTLFAIMPVHTEAVANIVGRAELLTALFVLLALIAVGPAPSALPSRLLARGTLVFALVLAAMLSKENGIAAPVLACALVGLNVPRRSGPSRRRSSIVTFTACATAVILYVVLRYWALEGRWVRPAVSSAIVNEMLDATAAQRVWGGFQLFGTYIAKTLAPATLCMDYSYRSISLARSWTNTHTLIGLTTAVVLIVVGVQAWRRGLRGVALSCLAVPVCYFPVSNTLFLINNLFAERFWYLPSAFLAIALAPVLVAATAGGWRRQAGLAVLTVVVLAGLARGWVRNAEWSDNGTLFASGYRVHPTSVQILHAYGGWLATHGRTQDGIILLERAVQLAPGFTEARVRLARAYMRTGHYGPAIEALQAARMQVPEYPGLLGFLEEAMAGASAAGLDQTDTLRIEYERAPDNLAKFIRYADAVAQAGRIGEALQLFDQQRRRFQDRPGFHKSEAVIRMLAGQQEAAIVAYRESSRLDPRQPDVLAELAMALMDRHTPEDIAEATKLVEQAYRLAPREQRVLLARAELYAAAGNRDEAIRIYEELIRQMKPGPARAGMVARLEIIRRG